MQSENRLQKLLTPTEVANLLGVPIRTLHKWRYFQEGPHAIKIGRHLRYSEEDLQAWLDEQRGRRIR